MTNLVLAALFLFASHAVLSAPGLRPKLISALGQAVFYTLYSAISLVALVGFIWAFMAAGPGDFLYTPSQTSKALTVAVMPLALLLMVGRVTTPYGQPAAPNPPLGIYRVCRFPGSAGLLLWSLLHLGNVGEDRTVVAFLTMAVISLFAMVKNERLRRGLGESHLAATSLVPFRAILQKRQKLAAAEIGWGRLGLTLAAYALILFFHAPLFGADPLSAFRF